ncbi:MAG: SIMPL domain-containing protein [Actinobacteria bacterium]|nr:SIMPL domain-containing protein [Actinomycetota bacterium]NCU90069.1 SIMPL domain-containing protein [Actinomycetota bacterium]
MSENENQRTLSLIVSAAILAIAMGLGLNQVGSGFASRSGEGISVTGSARVNVSADKAVWTLNAEQVAPTISESVKRVENATVAVSRYLTDGGVPSDSIELGSVSAYAQEEFLNGNNTGRILNYRGSRTITVRSTDVQLIKKLSSGIGSLLQSGVSVANYGPQYYVSKLSELRPELLKQAMEDAQVRAKAIVEATGGKVGNVMSVRSGPFQVTSPDSVDTSSGGYYDTSTIEKTITSTVTVSFKVN